MSTYLSPRVLPALTALLLFAAPASHAATLEITYLANEGYLLRSGDDAVLIDAFVSEPYSIYAAVPAATLAAMIAGESPFDSIDLALVSHLHRDHFQPEPARAFLRAQPRCRLVSSPDVVTALGIDPDADAQVERTLPKPGERVVIERGDIRVEVLRLQHGGERWAAIHNLGHIIHLGGKKVLHIGDAGMDPAMFAPYELTSAELDVALVPYWYFDSNAGRAIIEAHLHAALTIATHVPAGEVAAVRKDLSKRFPEVLLLSEPMQTIAR